MQSNTEAGFGRVIYDVVAHPGGNDRGSRIGGDLALCPQIGRCTLGQRYRGLLRSTRRGRTRPRGRPHWRQRSGGGTRGNLATFACCGRRRPSHATGSQRGGGHGVAPTDRCRCGAAGAASPRWRTLSLARFAGTGVCATANSAQHRRRAGFSTTWLPKLRHICSVIRRMAVAGRSWRQSICVSAAIRMR